MIATEQEMRACRIEKEDRDYCAHHFLKVEQCRFENWPYVVKCGAEVHAWNKCYYDE